MASLNVKLSFPTSMLEAGGLVKLGRFFVEYLDLSSWWSRFSAKLAVYAIMDLVVDMYIYTNR